MMKHSVSLDLQQNHQYTFYLKAKDTNGNISDSSAVININADTTKEIFNWSSPVKTFYLRKSVALHDVKNFRDLRISLKGHDGAVIYLNGNEVIRYNMIPVSDVTYGMTALDTLTD